jgi:Tetratricopeptide repeat
MLSASGAPAWSQDASRSVQDRLWQAVAREPTNYDLTFDLVRVSTQIGDYEAAIGALERLLFYNPDLARVRYELGSLYYRLGSYEMAARYFKEALEKPGLDRAARERIDTYLPLAKKQLQPSRFSAFLQAGIRTQSNAAFAPDAGFVRLGGEDFALLPTAARRRPDAGVFALTGFSHDYDLQNQRGDVLETRLIGYATQQFRFSQFDVGFIEASFGPRLALAPEALPGWTVKPYVVGGASAFDGARFASGGAGLALGIPVHARLSLEPFVEWRQASFEDRPTEVVSTLGSGGTLTAGLAATVSFQEGVTLQTRTAYRREDARLPWQSFDQFIGEAALNVEFDPPVAQIPRRWTIAPFVKLIETRFDAANPVIDVRVRRHDDEWRVGAQFDAPLTATFGVSALAQYARTSSNLPNYRTDNWSFAVGPTARF